MSIKPNKIQVAIVQILTFFSVAIIILVTYSTYAEHKAEKSAQDFCAMIKVGTSTDDLLRLALANGADKKMTRWYKSENEPDELSVIFTGANPLSRHVCWITSVNAKVSTAGYRYLD